MSKKFLGNVISAFGAIGALSLAGYYFFERGTMGIRYFIIIFIACAFIVSIAAVIQFYFIELPEQTRAWKEAKRLKKAEKRNRK